MRKTDYLLAITAVITCSAFAFWDVILAWTDPTLPPAGGNVGAPLNIGSNDQSKSGNLSIGTGLNYWITKSGDSFALKNNTGAMNFVVGQDGNIGIGTTAPGATLDVNGNIRISGGTPGAGKVLTSDASGLASWNTLAGTLPSATSGQTLRHDGSAWVANNVIYNNGANVGIGTTAPGAKLEIAGQVKITGGLPGAGKVLTSDANGLASWTTASGALPAGTSGQTLRHDGSAWVANNMIYNNGTNAGVGTASPDNKLDVNGILEVGTGTRGAQLISTAADNFTLMSQTNTPNTNWQIGSGNGSGSLDTAKPYITSNGYISLMSGNVGIGTASPTDKLDIRGITDMRGVKLYYDTWDNAGQGDGGAKIVNDNGSYKALMIVGSDQSQGYSRWVRIWDSLWVSSRIDAPAFYYTSDASLKKDIVPISNSIDKISGLNGVYFRWKSNNEPSMGLIAQDVEKVFPEAVSTSKETGLKSVDYGKLVAPLIETVKNQQDQINGLRDEVSQLRAELDKR